MKTFVLVKLGLLSDFGIRFLGLAPLRSAHYSRLVLAGLLLFLSGPSYALAVTGCATAQWTASADPSVVGYRVCYGTSANALTNFLDVTTNATTLGNLLAGTNYSFSVASRNAYGMVGAATTPVAYTPGVTVTSPPPTLPPPPDLTMAIPVVSGSRALPTITFPVCTGMTYQLQISTDLQTWATLATTNAKSTGPLTLTDPSSPTSSTRFYRVMISPTP